PAVIKPPARIVRSDGGNGGPVRGRRRATAGPDCREVIVMVLSSNVVPRLSPRAWLVLRGDALSAVGSGLTLPFFLVSLHRVRGIELGVAGLILATVAVAGLTGNPAGGWLADRIGPRRAVMAGLVIAAAGAAGFAAVHTARAGFAAAGVYGFGMA